MRYVYFVSFSHVGGQGNISMHREYKISTYEDIKSIQKLIMDESNLLKEVVVNNFILLEYKNEAHTKDGWVPYKPLQKYMK